MIECEGNSPAVGVDMCHSAKRDSAKGAEIELCRECECTVDPREIFPGQRGEAKFHSAETGPACYGRKARGNAGRIDLNLSRPCQRDKVHDESVGAFERDRVSPCQPDVGA